MPAMYYLLLLLLSRFSCVRLCNPIDSSPPGSSVPGILQARILEWVAISISNACTHAKLFQSCSTLCDPTDSSPPGSSVHGILQARILEWVAISFSCIISHYITNYPKARGLEQFTASQSFCGSATQAQHKLRHLLKGVYKTAIKMLARVGLIWTQLGKDLFSNLHFFSSSSSSFRVVVLRASDPHQLLDRGDLSVLYHIGLSNMAVCFIKDSKGVSQQDESHRLL